MSEVIKKAEGRMRWDWVVLWHRKKHHRPYLLQGYDTKGPHDLEDFATTEDAEKRFKEVVCL